MKRIKVLAAMLLCIFCTHAFLKEGSAPASANGQWSVDIDLRDMGFSCASEYVNNGNDYATDPSGKFKYGFRHGTVSDLAISKFDSITTNGSTTYSFANSDSSFCKANQWQMTTASMTPDVDGFIVEFVALEEITWGSKQTKLGGWMANTYNRYYILRDGDTSPELLYQQEFSGSDETSLATEPITLQAGDKAYFEWIKKPTTTSTRNCQSKYEGKPFSKWNWRKKRRSLRHSRWSTPSMDLPLTFTSNTIKRMPLYCAASASLSRCR